MTCNGDGKVYKTTNGGGTWNLVLTNAQAFFRCIVMVDSLHAFVGNFGYYAGSSVIDSNAVYETTDGGTTWTPAPIPAPTRIGICGLSKYDPQHIYGVGRIEGPTSFIRTSDGGTTWSYRDMSPYCGFLVDCYFPGLDTGFVVGGTDDSLELSVPIVLRTFDGGSSWDTVQIGPQNPQSWCWKINFPSAQTGYITIERDHGSVDFLKTTDAGNTWTFKNITNTHFNLQGIGFVNDTVGWAGGYYGNNLYETTNGGDSWSYISNVWNVNRIRKLNDTLLWASGKLLYTVTPTPATHLAPHDHPPLLQWSLRNCNEPKCVEVEVDAADPEKIYTLYLYDVAGRLIRTRQVSGQGRARLDLHDLAYSLLYFVLSDGENYDSKVYLNH